MGDVAESVDCGNYSFYFRDHSRVCFVSTREKSEYSPDEIITPANNYPHQPSERALEFQRNLPAWLEETRTQERTREAGNEARQLKLKGWEAQLRPEEMEEYLEQQRQFLQNPGPPIGVPADLFK